MSSNILIFLGRRTVKFVSVIHGKTIYAFVLDLDVANYPIVNPEIKAKLCC